MIRSTPAQFMRRILAVVTLTLASLGGGHIASAQDESEAEYAELQNAFVWSGAAEASPLRPFAGIPGVIAPGLPYSRSAIESSPGRSVATGAIFYASEKGEEALLDTLGGSSGNTDPVNPAQVKCANPAGIRESQASLNVVGNTGNSLVVLSGWPRSLGNVAAGLAEAATNSPETREQATTAIATFEQLFGPYMKQGGTAIAENSDPLAPPEGTPGASVNCTERVAADSWASSGAVQTQGFTAGSGIGTTNSRFDPEKEEVVSEARSVVQTVDLGTVSLSQLTSWVRMVHPTDGDPTISYEMTVADAVANGDSVLGVNQDGMRLAGSDVPIEDVLTQFSEQASQYGDALKELATFGVVLMEPKVEKDREVYTATTPTIELLAWTGQAFVTFNEIVAPLKEQQLPVPIPIPGGNVGPGGIGDNLGLQIGWAQVASHLIELPEFSLGGLVKDVVPVDTGPVVAGAFEVSGDEFLEDAGFGAGGSAVAMPGADDATGGDFSMGGVPFLPAKCDSCESIASGFFQTALLVLVGTIATGLAVRRRLVIARR